MRLGVLLALLGVTLAGCGSVQRVHTVTRYKTVTVKRSVTRRKARYLPQGVAQVSRYDFIIRKGAAGDLIQGLCPDTKTHQGGVGAYGVTSLRNGDTYVQCYDPSTLRPPPRFDEMSYAQFLAIQKGEPVGALDLLYPRIARDHDGSGDTSFLSTNGHAIYVIDWKCLDKHCDQEVVKDTRIYPREKR